MGVVEGRPQNLTARNVLERRRDAAVDLHFARIHWQAGPETGQGRAIGPDQECRLDQIAARLLDGEGRQIAIEDRPLRHDPVDRQFHLLPDLGDGQFRHLGVAPAILGHQAMGVIDSAFAPFTATYMAQFSSAEIRMLRGNAAI